MLVYFRIFNNSVLIPPPFPVLYFMSSSLGLKKNMYLYRWHNSDTPDIRVCGTWGEVGGTYGSKFLTSSKEPGNSVARITGMRIDQYLGASSALIATSGRVSHHRTSTSLLESPLRHSSPPTKIPSLRVTLTNNSPETVSSTFSAVISIPILRVGELEHQGRSP